MVAGLSFVDQQEMHASHCNFQMQAFFVAANSYGIVINLITIVLKT